MKTTKSAISFIIIVILTTIAANAQKFEWKWTFQGGGSGWDHGYSLATDKENNILIRGKFVSSAYFGDTVISTTQDEEDYLAKYDKNSNFIWVRSIAGNANWEKDRSIVTDDQNNIYLVGYFNAQSDFDHFTLNPKGDYDIYLAKLDVNGNYCWAIKAGGNLTDRGYCIGYFNGSIIISGYFSDTAFFESTKIISTGKKDVFLASYDTSGNLNWVKKAGGLNNDFANCLAIDNGFIYLTGNFEGNAQFEGKTVTSIGSNDVFIAKYDLNGELKWVINAGGTGDVEGKSICTANGNVYLTGSFSGNATFGTESISSKGQSDVYIANYNDQGDFQWLRKAGGDGMNEGNSIISRNNNIYLTGSFGNSISFNDTSLICNGSKDIFIACYDHFGKCLWAEKAGTSNGSMNMGFGNSIALDNENNILIGGEYSGITSFGNANLSPNGSFDMFLSKITDLNFPESISELPNSNQSRVFPNPSSGNFNIECSNCKKPICIEVYSELGKLVFKIKIANSTNIDLSEFPDGMYLIRFSNYPNSTQEILLMKTK